MLRVEKEQVGALDASSTCVPDGLQARSDYRLNMNYSLLSLPL